MHDGSAFCVHRYPAVIAYVFVASRCRVEKRGLAAIRVTYQRYVDLLLGPVHGTFYVVFRGVLLPPAAFPDELFRFGLRHYFDHGGFASAQRDFIVHDLVFDRVFERCVEFYGHRFAVYESHFHDAPTESPVSEDLQNDGRIAGFEFG